MITLSTPVETGSVVNGVAQTATTLTFKKPKAGLLMQAGLPVTTKLNPDGSRTEQPDMQVIGEWIAILSGIPISSVEDMEIKDFMAAFAEISAFFS